MALRLGSATPSKLYLGATEVTKAYLGASEVYSSAPTAWTPAALPDLALWLDASDAGTITLNGGNVSQWDDKSGNARDATQATASRQASYNAVALNGKPTVSQTERGRYMDVAGSASVVNAYAVISATFGDNFIVSGSNGTNAPTSELFVLGEIPTDIANITVSFDGTASTTTGRYRFNGGTLSASDRNHNTTQPSPSNFILEGRFDNPFSLNLIMGRIDLATADTNPMAMGELVWTSSVLSDTDRQKLEGYLAWKWGLSYALPNDHPYKWDTSLFGGTDLSGFDADAKTYITSVETADKQDLETGVRTAVNDFVVGCKADGIWAAIKASAILAGARTLTGALTPLVGTAPTNFNFVSGDYNRETGLIGNGTTKYLDSNRNNNADPQNSKHMAVYVGAAPTNTSALIGAREGVSADNGSSQLIHVQGPPASSNFRLNCASAALSASGIDIGLAGVSRTGASAVNWRHSSNLTGTDTIASQTPFSVNMHVFQRAGTSGNVPTNARMSFYSIGEAIDLALLDTRVSALMTAIDGAIP